MAGEAAHNRGAEAGQRDPAEEFRRKLNEAASGWHWRKLPGGRRKRETFLVNFPPAAVAELAAEASEYAGQTERDPAPEFMKAYGPRPNQIRRLNREHLEAFVDWARHVWHEHGGLGVGGYPTRRKPRDRCETRYGKCRCTECRGLSIAKRHRTCQCDECKAWFDGPLIRMIEALFDHIEAERSPKRSSLRHAAEVTDEGVPSTEAFLAYYGSR